MAHVPAQVMFALALALPITLLLSWGVLHQYKRALLRWMQREPAPNLANPSQTPDLDRSPASAPGTSGRR